LAAAGGKGLFAAAVEEAVLQRQADLAVHSYKDLPTRPTPGLMVVATPRRADPRDCLVSPHGSRLEDLPPGAVLGTASPRRAAQAKALRPDLQVKNLRGNVETRLRKALEEKAVNAAILSMAGLQRAGHEAYATAPLACADFVPAAAQGALAVQARLDDHKTLSRVLPINDPDTAEAVHAEREVVARLGGDCHSALGVHVEPPAMEPGEGYRLRAAVFAPDGGEAVRVDRALPVDGLDDGVAEAVEALRAEGAERLLHA
jgi:hydroxymethylbilane synthase